MDNVILIDSAEALEKYSESIFKNNGLNPTPLVNYPLITKPESSILASHIVRKSIFKH